MKIIGKTENGYIVEATDDELAHAAGYHAGYAAPGWDANLGGRWGRGAFPIGTKLKVTDAHRYMQELRNGEDKARDSAAQLKALATMISAALPTTVIPPKTGEAAAEPAA
jgi:spore maturation protein SpmA